MTKTAILVHLDPPMLDELNHLSGLIKIPRSELIRRCLSRDLKFVRNVEVSGLKSLIDDTSRQYVKLMERSRKELQDS